MPFAADLIDRLQHLQIRDAEDDARYRDTYPLFLDYFRNYVAVPHLTETDAKLAVTLVYSWMAPAKLNTDGWAYFPAASDALRELTDGDLSHDRLGHIRAFVGGSLIATSKFLHLFEPERFAIWDRRVAWAAYRYRHHYQFSAAGAYLGYLEDLKGLQLPPHAHSLVSGAIGDATEMRKKEYALFHLGIMDPPP